MCTSTEMNLPGAALSRSNGYVEQCIQGDVLRATSSDLIFYMAREAIQDRLPSGALLFLGVGGFTVKGDLDGYARITLSELNNTHPIAKGVLDEAVRYDFCVLASEVESEGTVFGLHARRKLPARP